MQINIAYIGFSGMNDHVSKKNTDGFLTNFHRNSTSGQLILATNEFAS